MDLWNLSKKDASSKYLENNKLLLFLKYTMLCKENVIALYCQ